eukprot:366542-Chlamydomonas_euryale.AAC.2
MHVDMRRAACVCSAVYACRAASMRAGLARLQGYLHARRAACIFYLNARRPCMRAPPPCHTHFSRIQCLCHTSPVPRRAADFSRLCGCMMCAGPVHGPSPLATCMHACVPPTAGLHGRRLARGHGECGRAQPPPPPSTCMHRLQGCMDDVWEEAKAKAAAPTDRLPLHPPHACTACRAAWTTAAWTTSGRRPRPRRLRPPTASPSTLHVHAPTAGLHARRLARGHGECGRAQPPPPPSTCMHRLQGCMDDVWEEAKAKAAAPAGGAPAEGGDGEDKPPEPPPPPKRSKKVGAAGVTWSTGHA